MLSQETQIPSDLVSVCCIIISLIALLSSLCSFFRLSTGFPFPFLAFDSFCFGGFVAFSYFVLVPIVSSPLAMVAVETIRSFHKSLMIGSSGCMHAELRTTVD
jgi:hypothetical protein